MTDSFVPIGHIEPWPEPEPIEPYLDAINEAVHEIALESLAGYTTTFEFTDEDGELLRRLCMPHAYVKPVDSEGDVISFEIGALPWSSFAWSKPTRWRRFKEWLLSLVDRLVLR